MSSYTRKKMIRSAAILMRERGVEATSFSDVLEHSGAPRGSIYHHFPGGKAQLVEEATRYAGDFLAAGLAAALGDEDPATAVRRFSELWREALRDSGFSAGCAVVAGALDTHGAREAAGGAFAGWEDLLAQAFEQHEVAPERARSLATLAIAAIEGAIVLARAQRSETPLDRVAQELEQLVLSAIASPASL